MEIIFFEQPLVGIAALILIALGIISKFVGSPLALTVVNCANYTLHAVLLSYLFLVGGTFEEALLLVLISSALALIQCPKPRKEDGGK